MSEIEVGEYVRTKNKGIKRIDAIFENKTVNKYGYEIGSDWEGKEYGIIKTTDIIKYSKNILDLIEDGDIVNGMLMEEFDDDDGTYLGYAIYEDGLMDVIECVLPLSCIKIKTILTHEQYEQNCYEVEG